MNARVICRAYARSSRAIPDPQQRFHFHFTPLHASWVNQIELWFACYTRRVLRHASHTSIAHLRERTEQFVGAHNQVARPFKWSFRGYPLQTGAS
nr:transposase [Cupriavidus numazuensis]